MNQLVEPKILESSSSNTISISNWNQTITFSSEFQQALQKEIEHGLEEYLKYKLDVDLLRWKDNNETITIQISLNGQVLSEKTFQV